MPDTKNSCDINLFADELPSLEEIRELSNYVNSNASNLAGFTEQLEKNLGSRAEGTKLAVGIGLYLSGKYKQAAEKLEKGKDCAERFLYLGFSLRKTGQYDKAVESFDKALENGLDKLIGALEKAETYIQAKDFSSAEKQIKSCNNFEDVSTDYHCQLGKFYQGQGQYKKAMEQYEKAIELSQTNQTALFRLAYLCDMYGDEDAAIDYYKQICKNGPCYVSALTNLAVLLEDRSEFEKALKYINIILDSHPNNCRARLFKKDIESSTTMFYDEEKEKKKNRKNKILETPISDFELSVRSRNCLRKMNISTLGDLLKISESELLSYKNFGETSLMEIKEILEPRNLHLGMNLDELQQDKDSSEENSNEQNAENQELLDKTLDELKLSVRARKCVERLNLRNIGELVQKTEAELLGVKNFGVTSLNEIKEALNGLGLSLRKLED
jgi:DNA-directed RNA polymerase subunit alpha